VKSAFISGKVLDFLIAAITGDHRNLLLFHCH
jgi:hypothetical protein